MVDCSLRPVRESDLIVFETEFYTPERIGDLQWFGYRNLTKLRAEYAATGYISCDGGRLTVETSGSVAGQVQWNKAYWGPPETSWCWEIGITLVQDMRGKGLGTQAQRLLVDYLLAHTQAVRIQAATDVANMAEQHALIKIGFRQEGIVRAAQWRAGKWHDQILYSLLRGEWTSRKI